MLFLLDLLHFFKLNHQLGLRLFPKLDLLNFPRPQTSIDILLEPHVVSCCKVCEEEDHIDADVEHCKDAN